MELSVTKQREQQMLARLHQQIEEEKQKNVERKKKELEEGKRLMLENEQAKLLKAKMKEREREEENEAIRKYAKYLGKFTTYVFQNKFTLRSYIQNLRRFL